MARQVTLKDYTGESLYPQTLASAVFTDGNRTLQDLVDAGYTYKGVATPTTNPGIPTAKVFYITTTPGTYVYFSGVVVNEGEVAILKYDPSAVSPAWTKDVTGVEIADRINQLAQKIGAWGLNIFDEQFEVGDISGSGEPISGSTTLRTINFVPCFGNWDYSISMDKAFIYYYDANKSFISLANLENSDVFHTPNTAAFFKLVLFSSYGTTYHNDVKICQKFNWIPDTQSIKSSLGGLNIKVDRNDGAWGLSILDEEFEVGDIDVSGVPVSGSTTLRTKNYSKCAPNAICRFAKPVDWVYDYLGYIYFYNEDKSFISLQQINSTIPYSGSVLETQSITCPANAHYFKLVLSSAYGTTYNNDIRVFQKFNWSGDVAYLNSKFSDWLQELKEYTITNIYDELYEVGDIDTHGDPVPYANTLRTKNFARCYPNTLYKFTKPQGWDHDTMGIIYFYDKNKNFIEYKFMLTTIPFDKILETQTITSSANAEYFKVVLSSAYGTTYNNDIKFYQKDNISKNIVDVSVAVPELQKDTKQIDNIIWELGDIGLDGNLVAGSTTLRTKNYVDCVDADISILCDRSLSPLGYIYFYDKNKNFVFLTTLNSGEIATNGYCYFKVVLNSSYGTTYNNDVYIISNKKLGTDYLATKAGLNGLYNQLNHTLFTYWEIGDINGSGQPISGSTTLRTKDYIKCSAFRSMKVNSAFVDDGNVGFIYFYDNQTNFLSLRLFGNGIVDLCENAAYFKIVLLSSYGTTYNNDVELTAYYSSPTILVVSKDGTGDFDSLTSAVAAATDGDIIYVRNGVYDNEAAKARYKNLVIIGESKYGTQIIGGGDYLDPPIEMNSGVLKNMTLYAYGETPTQTGRYAYALHADYEILANNSFIVENCVLKSKMGQGAVGMGLRGGCYVLFKDCDFICEHEAAFFMNETVTAPDWNQTPGDQHFEFNNCKFICTDSTKSVTARFEGYHSRGGFVYATFINNVFVHTGRTPNAYFYWPDERYWDPQCENIEGNIVIDGQGDKMINWFITEASFGNSIPALNYMVEGTINDLNP